MFKSFKVTLSPPPLAFFLHFLGAALRDLGLPQTEWPQAVSQSNWQGPQPTPSEQASVHECSHTSDWEHFWK